MIKNSRKILKFINDNTSSTKGLAASNIATSFKMDLNYVNDVLDYLYERELIKIFSKHQTYNTYTSTAKGRDYFKMSFDNIFFKYIYPLITAGISFALSLLLD